jgi:hypothetical protein
MLELKRERVWIVDYDIPSTPPRRRIAFYRAVYKVFSEAGIDWEFSTMSVHICADEAIARTLHSLAKQFGKSHLYRGVQVD